MDIRVTDSRRRGGWFWIDNEIFDMDLDPYAFMVYCFLVRIADRGSEVACVSTKKMAKALGISRDRLYKALKTLEEANMVVRKRRKSEKGADVANLYFLTSKEDWKGPDKGVRKTDTPLSGTRTPPCPQDGHPVSATRTPPVRRTDTSLPSERVQTVENQRDDSRVSVPINTYIDQYIKDQYIYIHTHNKDVCVSEKISNEIVSHEIGGKAESELGIATEEPEKNKKGKQPTASLREISDAPAEAIRRFEKLNLERLTPHQAAFLYLNGVSEEALLATDKNEKITNPVGYLIKVFGIKLGMAKHGNLLVKPVKEEKAEEQKEAVPEDDYEELNKFLEATANKLGINIQGVSIKDKVLLLAERLFTEQLDCKERKLVDKTVNEAHKEVREDLFTILVWRLYLAKLQIDEMTKRKIEADIDCALYE